MKFAILYTFLILGCSSAFGQNLIGRSNAEIRKYMKQNRKEMNFDNVRNSMFSYLKYSDNSDTQTILFFLNDDSVCRSIKVICDTVMKAEKIKELDAKYKKSGKDSWIDSHGGKNYLIKFRDEKWSCSITYETE
jgi:hypothetical protein